MRRARGVEWALLGSNTSKNIAGNPACEQGGDAEDDAFTADDVAELLAHMPPELLGVVLQRAAELKGKESAEWGKALKEQHE